MQRAWLSVGGVGLAGIVVACGGATAPGTSVASLSVTPSSLSLLPAHEAQLTVTPLDGQGHLVSGIAIIFTSSDSSVVTVSVAGLARAVGAVGDSAVITVSGGGVTARVSVGIYPVTLTVTPTSLNLYVTQEQQLTAKALDKTGDSVTVSPVFSSSDTSTVTVSSAGVVRAVGQAGDSAVVTVSGGGASVQVAVEVYAAEVLVTPPSVLIASGDDRQLSILVRDLSHDTVMVPLTFSSSNAPDVSVSASGLVHAAGTAGDSAVVTVRGGGGEAEVPVRIYGLAGRYTGLSGRPYAAGVSGGNVAYVGLLDAAQLVRADLPDTAFSPAVNVGNTPTEIAFNSAATYAYVTAQSDARVDVVDVSTNQWVDTIPVTGAPFEVLVAPGDSVLYVTTNADSVYGIRLATKAIVARFPTDATANGMVARDTMLYVSTRAGGTVIEFNLRTRSVGRTFAVGGVPQKLALSPDGQELYVANESGWVQFWDLVSGAQVGANVDLPGSAGYGIARSPVTGLLYVSSASYGGGNIHVVDPGTRTLLKTYTVGGATRRVVFDAAGLGVVPNENGWVDFIR
jgi:YVTN family beta-propeller protein